MQQDLRGYFHDQWSGIFEEQLRQQPTIRAAYYATEEIFEKKTGSPYYSGYDSFKAAQTYWNRKRKTK